MSFLDIDRFHRAARDGYLDLLQEANRKDLNSRDEDGMTPAMWASYYGHLDALRLIVGRGGDPDKCDHYGNTSLHCASGNGHMDCVSFLVNFGVNLWALDNDFHTAKDVAVLNRKDDVLRLLDQAQSKHTVVNKKLVQRLKEKSIYDAEKRIKNYRKLQVKAAKRAEKEERILLEQRQKRGEDCPSTRLSAFRRDSRFMYAPKFSDIVHAGEKKDYGAVAKKSVSQRKKCVVFRPGDVIERSDEREDLKPYTKREIHFTVKSDEDSNDSKGDPKPASSDAHSSGSDANSDVLQTADSGIGDELHDSNSNSVGIFDRPGFGTVAFRNSAVNMSSLTSNSTQEGLDEDTLTELRCLNGKTNGHGHNDSIGSASSLVRRHISWEDECDADTDDSGDDSCEDEATEPISLFLTAVGLAEYIPLFQSEKIDLESLSLLSEDDLKVLGMPLGPRRKLGKALQQRSKILEDPGVVQDSRL